MTWLPDVQFATQAFLTPKQGSDARDCEDALSINRGRMRFCVADGATEGFASRDWARLLVKHWTRAQEPILTPERLASWSAALGSHFERRWRGRRLPWYAEEKARSGAFAAFLGLTFFEAHEQLHWRAIALGDACLIVRRNNAILSSFPLSDPEEFGFRPPLLPSNPQRTIVDKVEIRSAPIAAGDTFFLLTDAIAAWFLRAASLAPEGIQRLEETLRCGERDGVAGFVEQERLEGSLRNDDVGIVRVEAAPQ